jgi:hypothetical protein
MLDRNEIDWGAIAQATLVTMIAWAVLGGLWGMMGAWVFLMKGMDADDGIHSTAAHVSGFLYSLVPVVIGTKFLIWCVHHDQTRHCLCLGFALAGVSLAFGCVERSFAWHDILYYLAIVPTALITERMSRGNQPQR